jgi:hypothetical protein
MMRKAYNLSQIGFENDYLVLSIDNQIVKVKLSEISEKLSKATEQERNDFKVSPSGYGIHWRLLDEDLSINGLLKKL